MGFLYRWFYKYWLCIGKNLTVVPVSVNGQSK